MEILSTIFYFIVTISVLVFVHEFGHFITAKYFGMRVEVFAIGMGTRLFGYNKISKFTFGKQDESIGLGDNTDYRISLLPIGGYVKVSGIIDESFDKTHVDTPAKDFEYRAKPVWQRMIFVCGGVVANILLAIVIFWCINIYQGEQHRATTTIGFVLPESIGDKIGLQIGDKIISINDKSISDFESIFSSIYSDFMGKDLSVSVERNGKIEILNVLRKNIPDISEAPIGILPLETEVVANMVIPNKPASKSGLKNGDIILLINSTPVKNQFEATKIIKQNPLIEIKFEVKRKNNLQTFLVTPGADSLVGIQLESHYTGPITKKDFGVFEAIPKSVSDVSNATILFGKSIVEIFKGTVPVSKSIGGPVRIAQFATRSAEIGLISFLGFLALLSISLAVLNILPIPAADGGHFVLLLYEAIVRKPIPVKIQMAIQQVGVTILIGLMILILYNDVIGF
ncbi:MAG: RIP metalloprotease RseP [Bacteroidetes bacterium]|nr:RIP metalloprotease RseP [Bacteroidota bacterium]